MRHRSGLRTTPVPMSMKNRTMGRTCQTTSASVRKRVSGRTKERCAGNGAAHPAAVSVDDFGAGYSSLSYLRNFPIDALKVNRSFIRNIVRDREDAAITASIMAMAHTLGLKVVAEGVETEDPLGYLAALECDFLQGYLIGRPIASEDFLKLLSAEVTGYPAG